MQLFVTDPDPQMCAIALDDKRVIKITLEVAQMISTVSGIGYRPTHEDHPLTHWVKKNLGWACSHYIALASEYSHRTGNCHASLERIADFAYSHRDSQPPAFGFFNYARNRKRGLDFSWVRDVHQAYRMYLRGRWMNDLRKPKWTNRTPPAWLDIGEGMGSDGQLLAMRARRMIGFATNGTHGHIPCPQCGDIIEWYCIGPANYVELRCITDDCVHFKEVLRQ